MLKRSRMLMGAGAALVAAACGGGGDSASSSGGATSGGGSTLSGTYVGEVTELGVGLEIDFRKDGSAVLTFVENGERVDMDCTYQSGEARIALSCFGSSGISISRLEGGDLEADMDGAIVRLKKR